MGSGDKLLHWFKKVNEGSWRLTSALEKQDYFSAMPLSLLVKQNNYSVQFE